MATQASAMDISSRSTLRERRATKRSGVKFAGRPRHNLPRLVNRQTQNIPPGQPVQEEVSSDSSDSSDEAEGESSDSDSDEEEGVQQQPPPAVPAPSPQQPSAGIGQPPRPNAPIADNPQDQDLASPPARNPITTLTSAPQPTHDVVRHRPEGDDAVTTTVVPSSTTTEPAQTPPPPPPPPANNSPRESAQLATTSAAAEVTTGVGEGMGETQTARVPGETSVRRELDQAPMSTQTSDPTESAAAQVSPADTGGDANRGTAVGITFGALIGIAILITVAVLVFKKFRKNRTETPDAESGTGDAAPTGPTLEGVAAAAGRKSTRTSRAMDSAMASAYVYGGEGNNNNNDDGRGNNYVSSYYGNEKGGGIGNYGLAQGDGDGAAAGGNYGGYYDTDNEKQFQDLATLPLTAPQPTASVDFGQSGAQQEYGGDGEGVEGEYRHQAYNPSGLGGLPVARLGPDGRYTG